VAEDARLREITSVAEELRAMKLAPVLVGGMALVVMGSQRVTKDVDFLVSHPGPRAGELMNLFYDRGFELVSRVSEAGDVIATIDNMNVANSRFRIDKPASIFFYNQKIDLRIDLQLDFPVPAVELLEKATTIKIRSRELEIACPEDLLRLKKLAQAARSFAGDAQDIEFLERLS